MAATVKPVEPVRRDDSRVGMQRAEAAMLAVGSASVTLGIFTTEQPLQARLVQAALALGYGLGGWWLAAGGTRSVRTLELISMLAMIGVGIVVAVSEPLSASPFFMIWPITLIAYFAPRRHLIGHGAVGMAALALGLVLHSPSPIKFDMFFSTTLAAGLMAWLISSVTEQQEALRAELARAADTDPLTGVLNRRAFLPRLEQLVALTERTGVPLALVMFDLDHFKRINDTRGHLVGDRVLQHAAAALTSVSRAADLVARVGGEEFVVALPGAGAAEAARYAVRAAREMRDPPDLAIHVSTSAGICAYGPVARTADALLGRADEALYAAKVAGRGRWATWDGTLRVGQPFVAQPAGPGPEDDAEPRHGAEPLEG